MLGNIPATPLGAFIVKLEVVLASVFESVTGKASIAENDGLDP
jgi:hypothetical protein